PVRAPPRRQPMEHRAFVNQVEGCSGSFVPFRKCGEEALLVTACDGNNAWPIGPVAVRAWQGGYGPHGKSQRRKHDDIGIADQRKEDQPGQRSASNQKLRSRCTPAKKPPEDRVCDEGNECNVHEPHVGHVEEIPRYQVPLRVGERKTIGGGARTIGLMIAVRMPPRDAQEQRTGESDRSGPQSRTRGGSYCEPLAAGRVARRCAAGLQLVASNESRRLS